MKPLLINFLPGETAILIVAASLLAAFGVIAYMKYNNRLEIIKKFAPGYDAPFPTGNISSALQSPKARPVHVQLFENAYASRVQPTGFVARLGKTGSVAKLSNNLPADYAGPVVVEGSKYLWESRWSHLPSFEQGREGEERVVNTLVNTLGNGWYIFRNFVLPTENEDIDVVLVGPAGVFAMEVKAYGGEVKFERGRCYIKTAHGRMYRQKRGPVGQVRQSATRLNDFLREQGGESRNLVKPLTVMSGESAVERASTQSDVCTMTNLRSRVSDIATQSNLSQTEVRQLAGILQAATQEQTRFGLSRVH